MPPNQALPLAEDAISVARSIKVAGRPGMELDSSIEAKMDKRRLMYIELPHSESDCFDGRFILER